MDVFDSSVYRIGVCGKARSGKNTVGETMAHAVPMLVTLDAWAAPLKNIAMTMFGLDWQTVNGIDFDREAPYFPGGQSVRQMLQELGTNFGRSYDPDVWVKMALRRQYPTPWVVMTDTRFPNELAACDYSIWVERPGVEAGARDHESETSITSEMTNYTLVNDGTLADLKDKTLELFDQLRVQRMKQLLRVRS